MPNLQEVFSGRVSSQKTPDESAKKMAVLGDLHPRSQEEINRDLERVGLSFQFLMSEKDRLGAEIDAWLAFNKMTPRTALNYVEELVSKLREEQVEASEPEVRKYLWERTPRR